MTAGVDVRVAVVTGATAGMARATARRRAGLGEGTVAAIMQHQTIRAGGGPDNIVVLLESLVSAAARMISRDTVIADPRTTRRP